MLLTILALIAVGAVAWAYSKPKDVHEHLWTNWDTTNDELFKVSNGANNHKATIRAIQQERKCQLCGWKEVAVTKTTVIDVRGED